LGYPEPLQHHTTITIDPYGASLLSRVSRASPSMPRAQYAIERIALKRPKYYGGFVVIKGDGQKSNLAFV
jgi:hypothetical protein